MRIDEYAALDGIALADCIRRREVTREEVLDVARKAIAATNTKLNFMVGEMRTDVDVDDPAATSRFSGVPLLLKDMGPRAAGFLQELGSGIASGLVAPADSELTKRLRAAGFRMLGRTATPEFGSAFTTEPRVHGATLNPWDPTRSPGGSSGGAAVAVASGALPIAQGGDSAGSIRVPAHCCGVFGLKPTRGRNPIGPEDGEATSGLTVTHVLSRTVRDSAAVLDATAGPDVGCRHYAEPPKQSFLAAAGRDPGKLRIAVSTRSPLGGAVAADIRAAIEETARLCESLGHHVEEAAPQIDASQLFGILDVVWSANMYHGIANLARMTGRQATIDTLEATTLALYRRGERVSADELLGSFDQMNVLNRRIGNFFVDYDVLLTPVCARVAPRLGELNTDDERLSTEEYLRMSFEFAPFTAQYNVTGQPAMSVPLHQSAEGLPIGSQFVARFCAEETLFSLAAQLERAKPWRLRRPGVFAHGEKT